jgi:cell wall assembly regulator SMI1
VTVYAVMDETGTIIVNVISPDPAVVIDPSWIPLDGAPRGVWVGWTTPDNGATWVAPAGG